ncbi:MAG: hypothetical protein AAGA42_18955 [Actinomycetota bacterium]
MSKRLLLLTYNLRRGADLAEYDNFMRDVDYPVFRARPEVRSYHGYHIVGDGQGDPGFRHFDLLEVDDFADADKIFGHPDVAAHAGSWVERWSEHGPDAPPEMNFGMSFCERIDEVD